MKTQKIVASNACTNLKYYSLVVFCDPIMTKVAVHFIIWGHLLMNVTYIMKDAGLGC